MEAFSPRFGRGRERDSAALPGMPTVPGRPWGLRTTIGLQPLVPTRDIAAGEVFDSPSWAFFRGRGGDV